MARFVGPNLKTKPPLEKEFNTLSYESNLNLTILNISEVMSERVRVGICVSSSRVNATAARKG